MLRTLLIFSLSLMPLLLSAQYATLIKDIFPGSENGITTDKLGVVYDQRLLFAADDGVHGLELWSTDGTEAGTRLVKDINPGAEGSECQVFHLLGKQVIFLAEHPDLGRELWITDGTEAGTQLIRDINPGTGNGLPNLSFERAYYFVWNDVLYFSADNGSTGYELWRSDGSTAGTYLVKDFGFGNGFPEHYAVLNDRLYFSADSGASGRELWVTDGTTSNTRMVVDINPSIFADGPSHLFTFNDKLLFIAEGSDTDSELWISDGTAAGTKLLKDINPNGSGMETNPNTDEIRFHQIGDLVFFSANDGTHGKELWRTDGTTAGTQRVRVASAGTNAYTPQNFVVLEDILYYKYDDGTTGTELWRSDGTDAGTYMVKNIRFSSNSSMFLPTYFTTHQSRVYFNAKGDDNFGEEVWQSDGTEAGTIRVTDINPEFRDSDPGNFFSLGEDLLFAAYNPESGYELYRLGEAPALEIAYTTNSPLLCYEEANGRIEFAISGGVPPYEISWEDESLSGDTLTNLTAGLFAVTITDDAGQVQAFQIEIEQPEALLVEGSVTSETEGASDGSIALTISGGTAPYLIDWGTGLPVDTITTLTELAGGEYTVQVSDANGCVQSISFQVDVMTGLTTVFDDAHLQAFPNPASGQFTLQWSESVNEFSDKTLCIRNALGQVMLQQSLPDLSRKYSVLRSNWAAGIYYYQLKQGKQLLVSGKVVVR